MSEKQFDIFDEPFREAAEHNEPEYNEASWRKMEARLDKSLLPKPARWFSWFTDFLMIAILVTVAVQLQTAKPSVKNDHSANDTISIQNKTEQQAAAGKGTANESRIVTGTDAATGTTTNDISKQDGNDGAVLTGEENAGQHNKTNSPAEPISAGNSNTNADVSKATVKANQTKLRGDAIDDRLKKNAGEVVADANTSTGKKQSRYKPTKNAGIKSLDVLNSSITTDAEKLSDQSVPGKAADESFYDVVIDDDYQLLEAALRHEGAVNAEVALQQGDKNDAPNVAAPAVTRVKLKNIAFKGMYLQAGLAPEWSFISGQGAGPLTTAYGGAIGFASGKRWSVQAGIYATRKVYEAGPGIYKAKPGTYFYNLKIKHVDAFCNVLEIPVIFNYSLLQSGQHRLTASAGFASLVMQKETYDYDYMRMNGTPGYYKHTYQTGAFHPFAATYLSAGYQYSLSNRLAVMVTPFVKLPMYGIGEGSVKITSTGLLFGLQYNFADFSSKKLSKTSKTSKAKN